MILEVGPKGRMQFARDLMQTRLPGHAAARVRAARSRRQPVAEGALRRVHGRAAASAPSRSRRGWRASRRARSADKLKWEDYFENGVLAAVSAEMNRYTYTGHGNAACNWLEKVWPATTR